ncbi:aminoglycoside N(3)-acetyltransferase [Pseudobutyrivibrio sp. C4]|uniref:aminoglycoside N(3)-acetyltransferase n=1 Tax=Pseudobutyrivibrio sp. C4 TaxID=1520803 RepID=UPI000A4F632C|nr:AAC(3) family N-acetyltransferase [Pseudobutyrivibrio sp. C4]
MVHTALSKIGYVCGGAQAVIEALIEVVGEDGTIMMPAQSWKNLDPEDGVHWTVPEEYWQIIRDNWPAYDKRITPTNTMGAVAEAFRQWPGTLRSDHPARSVAAWGKHAEYLVNDHDLSNIFGEAFEQSNAVNKAMIGNAELRLMNQKILVDFAVDWIQKYRRG